MPKYTHKTYPTGYVGYDPTQPYARFLAAREYQVTLLEGERRMRRAMKAIHNKKGDTNG